jgi:hypothetical protein
MKSRKKPSEHDAVEIKNWLKKIIDSCDNTFHFEGAQVLINKFKEINNNETDLVEVQDYLNRKFNERHGIIK